MERLAEIFLELQEQGANNINLVTGTHYVPQIIEALDSVRGKLKIPVVYNSSGYETMETLRMLEGYVDIYLPDLKYLDSERSLRYSNASDYPQTATAAILEMFRQVGPVQYDERGMLKKGLIVRHMVMPGGVKDSINILNWIAHHLPLDDILVSIMSQYTPWGRAHDFPEIDRKLRRSEARAAEEYMVNLGLAGFAQDGSSAQAAFIPAFDLTGV